jgi:hypothetical protein
MQAPDRSVDIGLQNGLIDASLPFISQQGVVALTAAYGDLGQGLRGIEEFVRNYYQKNYPQIYASKQPSIRAAIVYLQNTYDRFFFPAMKVRWDTYYMNDGHFHFLGCSRCHDGQHKSVDGKTISSDCGGCHKILQQGNPGKLKFASGPEGLGFEHPVDIGDAWAQQACSSCHTGG